MDGANGNTGNNLNGLGAVPPVKPMAPPQQPIMGAASGNSFATPQRPAFGPAPAQMPMPARAPEQLRPMQQPAPGIAPAQAAQPMPPQFSAQTHGVATPGMPAAAPAQPGMAGGPQSLAEQPAMGAPKRKFKLTGRMIGLIVGLLVLIGGGIALALVLFGDKVDYAVTKASTESAISALGDFTGAWSSVTSNVQSLNSTISLQDHVSEAQSAYSRFQTAYNKIQNDEAMAKNKDVKAKFDTLKPVYQTFNGRAQASLGRVAMLSATFTNIENSESITQEVTGGGGSIDDVVTRTFLPITDGGDTEFTTAMQPVVESYRTMVQEMHDKITSHLSNQEVPSCEGITDEREMQTCLETAASMAMGAISGEDLASLVQKSQDLIVQISQIVSSMLMSPNDVTPVTDALNGLLSVLNTKAK